MIASTTLMPWLVTESPPPIVKAAALPGASPDADAEARALAAAVARGDEAAFRQLYDRYHQRLFRLVLVLGRGNETLAHDTVQTVWITTAAKLRRVESEAHLWNWLGRVARQHLARAWRHQQRDSVLIGLADPPESPQPDPSDALLEQYLDAALSDIESEDRLLLERFYFDGRSQKDLAAESGLTPKAVSSRLERARAKLRAAIARQLSHET